MNLSTRLLRLRERNHLTQQEVAKKIFLSQRAYSYYETGKCEPPVSRLFDLARVYGISVAELFRGVDRI